MWELRTNVRMCILVLMMTMMLFESLCYVQGGPKNGTVYIEPLNFVKY